MQTLAPQTNTPTADQPRSIDIKLPPLTFPKEMFADKAEADAFAESIPYGKTKSGLLLQYSISQHKNGRWAFYACPKIMVETTAYFHYLKPVPGCKYKKGYLIGSRVLAKPIAARLYGDRAINEKCRAFDYKGEKICYYIHKGRAGKGKV